MAVDITATSEGKLQERIILREYLLIACVAAGVTFLLTNPIRYLAVKTGWVIAVRARDVHDIPIPRVGGIAMFGGMLAALVLAEHLPRFQRSQDLQYLHTVLLGALIVWLAGAVDDKFELSALTKIGAQLIAAGIMVYQGLAILWLPIPGVGIVALSPPIGTLLTVTALLVAINAVNFIDGLDGLAAGVVAISGCAMFLYYYRLWFSYGMEPAALAAAISAVTTGMCLGFLFHNAHPARTFMGDSGAMLLGLLLSGACTSFLGQADPDALIQQFGGEKATVKSALPMYLPLILPAAVMALPLADLVLAVLRRVWRGKSPFSADQGHLHHRLMRIGHSHPRSVLIMWMLSALLSFGFVAYSVLPLTGTALTILTLGGGAFLILVRTKKKISGQ
ncbi:MraY family glycosyltransferase [Streptomyces sp. NPDC049916]|uniref:MraY family glycosyltransferase n=1 Tax=Streptomyces sp. NPDC049916 TaxID=3155156 RepID=UPI003430755F